MKARESLIVQYCNAVCFGIMTLFLDYYKFCLHKASQKSLFAQVINEFVKFLGFSSWLFLYGSSVIINEPLYIHTGHKFCHTAYYITAVGVAHCYSGGAGFALMRMLFIQFSTKVSFGQQVRSPRHAVPFAQSPGWIRDKSNPLFLRAKLECLACKQ